MVNYLFATPPIFLRAKIKAALLKRKPPQFEVQDSRDNVRHVIVRLCG
jgi:hypothetical protein